MSSDADDPNIFYREEVESSCNEDNRWDDTKLISAFDKVHSKAKQEVLEKVRKELNLTHEDVKGIISDAGSSASKSKKKNKKKKKKKGLSEQDVKKWEVGDACRAIYSEDGEEYEAKIIAIIDKDWCWVKYLGYENEEEVQFQDLTPSLGKEVIQMQIKMAELAQYPEEATDDQNSSIGSEIRKQATTKNTKSKPKPFKDPKHNGHSKPPFWNDLPRRSPLFEHVAPPPPLPPILPSHMAFFNNFDNSPSAHCTGNDQLDSMLLSWYMCGYYTGYYKRDSELQQNERN